MKPPKKVFSQHEAEQAHTTSQSQSQSHTETEFKEVEDLLRHDALHTPVPPSIAQRLEESLQQNPPPKLPWWRRFFKA